MALHSISVLPSPEFIKHICNLAAAMYNIKRLAHIILPIAISLPVLFVGMGVDVVRCSCTGLVQVVHCGADLEEHGCAPDEDCEIVEHVQLSPSDVVHAVRYNFHAEQFPIAVLPSLIAERPGPTAFFSATTYTHNVRISPPTTYLHFIRVLLI